MLTWNQSVMDMEGGRGGGETSHYLGSGHGVSLLVLQVFIHIDECVEEDRCHLANLQVT